MLFEFWKGHIILPREHLEHIIERTERKFNSAMQQQQQQRAPSPAALDANVRDEKHQTQALEALRQAAIARIEGR